LSEKIDKSLTIKITEELETQIGAALVQLDCQKSELIRAAIMIGLPAVLQHPAMLQIIDFEALATIKQR
jgi:uncharacterized membrane protein YqjE